MTSELTTEVLSGAVVAALSGVAGAAYQLHRRRSRPFVLITALRGDAFAGGDEVDVPEDVRRRLERSLLFEPLGKREPLLRVHRIFQSESALAEAGPDLGPLLQDAIKALERAVKDEDVLEAIRPPLSKTLFDMLITNALLTGRISMAAGANPSASPKKITAFYEDSLQGGCFYFDFPAGPVYFGSKLEESALKKNRLSGFVHSVEALERDTLRRAFSDLAQLLDTEMATVAATKGEVERIIDQHSGWETYIYIANYGETAMLVLPQAVLQVKKGRFDRAREEKCKLAVFYEKDGEERKQIEKNGVLISPNQERRIVFVTAERQASMTSGNELRGLFQDGVSRARIAFECVSAGLRARRTVKTAWLPFKGTD